VLLSPETTSARGEDASGAVVDIRWSLGQDLPEYRKGGCLTVLDGRITSVFGMRFPWGEMATMYVFDPREGQWRREADAPVGQCYVEGTECGSTFYSVGGRGALERGKVHNACFRLDAIDGRYAWRRIADLKESRGWAPSAAIGTKLFVFGGSQGGHGPTLSSVEMLDTATEQPAWSKVADIPGDSRGWCGAASVGEKLYVLGGSHFFSPRPQSGPDRKRTNEVWQLDPEAHQWTRRQPLPVRLSGFDCCTLADRYIIVVGGAYEAADLTPEMRAAQQESPLHASYYCPFVFLYDAHRDKWQHLPSLVPMPTNDIRAVVHQGRIYAVGGENVDPATSNTTRWFRIGKIITN